LSIAAARCPIGLDGDHLADLARQEHAEQPDPL
jgi:hypothetical protein